MKIATWNVERLKHIGQLDEIAAACAKVKADILVLTETDSRIRLGYKYCYQTRALKLAGYKSSENRVSIYANYPCVCYHQTFDPKTAICAELETERGNLLVYGTIMGIYGNRHHSFQTDVESQVEDFRRLTEEGRKLCVCGDFNCSFSDNYYFTKAGRNTLETAFADCQMSILTKNQPECIDHIALTSSFMDDTIVSVEEWNLDKSLSDHKGIAVMLC